MESSPKATFRTIIFAAGKNNTGIEIPEDVVQQLGAGKRPPVKVTINGYTYRNTIAVMGGQYLIGISDAHRKAGGLAAGDAVEVTLELDTEPRIVEVPADLQEALAANATAKAAYEKLSYSKQQGIVLPIKDAKTEDTRARRVEKAIASLLSGKV
ncbi:MAG TPA: YdeI/OmpD-associated family protein [Bacteroidia bacterium]|nr:YdeI/OmpD-associated family protein [Bacteroidia bacterium]